MNPKIALIFAVTGTPMAVLSPAIGQDAPKNTAGAQVHLSQLPERPPYNGVSKTAYGAGYFAYPSAGNVGSVSVTFRLPTITCHSQQDYEWLLPGIWVYRSGNLSQQVDINLNCNDGAILLTDVICIDGGSCKQSLPVNPGDWIVATLSETPSGTFGQIRDLTTGQAESTSGTAAPTTDDVVFVGVEGPSLFGGTVTKVPTFTTFPFAKVQFNGYYLSDWSPAHYNLATDGTHIQVITTNLTDHGDQFTASFNRN